MQDRTDRRRTDVRDHRAPRPAPRAGRWTAVEPLEARRMLAAAAYAVVDLGTLGGTTSVAYDLNAGGQVVGYSTLAGGAKRAFRFHDANGNRVADPGEMVDLGTLAGFADSVAYGINDAGVAVGAATVAAGAAQRAVRFPAGAGGTAEDLNLGDGSLAYAVNSAGTVVGGAVFGISYQAFRRTAAGAVTYLGTLGAYYGSRYSEGLGINDDGVVVGYSSTSSGESAFVRGSGPTSTPIGMATPDGLDFDYAWDINGAGHVAGEGYNASGDYHAFLYRDGVATDLGKPEGFATSAALGLNDMGQVVGSEKSSQAQRRAWLYTDGAMHDLNALIPAGSGWVLTEARAINDDGLIAATGRNAAGQTRAVLLVPVPPAQGVTITGTAGNDVIRLRRSVADASVVEALLNGGATPVATFPASATADVTIDAGGGDDVVELLDALPALPALSGGVGDDRLTVLAGTLALDVDLAALSVERLKLDGSASLTSSASQHLASLEVAGEARLSLPASAAAQRFIRAGAVSVAGNGTLDLGSGGLLAEAGGSQAVLDGLFARVASGRNEGAALWTGPGITSATAAGDAGLGLAAALNAGAGGAPLLASYLGEPLTASMAVVKLGPAGDANLDGRLDAGDYHAIDAGYALQLGGYAAGDFDYSGGATAADDYLVLDLAFIHGAAMGTATATAPAAPAPAAPAMHTEPDPDDDDEGGDDLLA